MISGAVHRQSGNVPFDTGQMFLLNFEYADATGFTVRLAVRRTGRESGPALRFTSVQEMLDYLAGFTEMLPEFSTDGVVEWLDLRLAEFGADLRDYS